MHERSGTTREHDVHETWAVVQHYAFLMPHVNWALV